MLNDTIIFPSLYAEFSGIEYGRVTGRTRTDYDITSSLGSKIMQMLLSQC